VGLSASFKNVIFARETIRAIKVTETGILNSQLTNLTFEAKKVEI